MNPFVMLRLGALFLALVVFAHCKPTDPAPDSVVHRVDTMSIAQLRTFSASVIPDKVQITDAGREGVFALDEADLASVDNMGVTLVTAHGHRYKRDFTGPANVFWFGVETSDADIGPELQTAVKATNELMIPDGNYTQLTSVRIRSNLTIRANAGKVLITLPQTYVGFVNAEDPSLPLQHVLFDGLSWNVTSRQTGTYGVIYIDGPTVSDLTVQNCASSDVAAKDSTNWLTLKIQAGKTATNIIVRNNNIQAKRMACEIFNHDNYNIYAGKSIEVSGNNFHDCHFGLSLSGPLSGLKVDNNLIKNCSLFGIEIAGAAQNVTITNNKFEGVFDKFLEGSNDGDGNGTIVGGMIITGNSTVGQCTGGVQLYNAGAATFSKNDFKMSGMLELTHSSAGGMYTDNTIESLANKAVICDNTPNNTFSRNTLSNKANAENQATFVAYGSKATNNVLTNNKLIKGNGGKPYEAVLGGSLSASMNYDETGAPIP